MSWLVLGATGQLGMRMVQTLKMHNLPAYGLARAGTDIDCDVTQAAVLVAFLDRVRPTVLVNCAAEVDLAACEADEVRAFAVNAAPVSTLAHWATAHQAYLVQISTDQFFAGSGPVAHDERAEIVLPHAYARSKYAGEGYAASTPQHLIVRTSLTDVLCGRGKTPFARWAIDQAATGRVNGFADYWCSTIDCLTLSQAIIDLVQIGAQGVINVASANVFSKADMIDRLYHHLGINVPVTRVSAADMKPARALSSGLNVHKAESLLGYGLPTLDTVASRLAAEERKLSHAL